MRKMLFVCLLFPLAAVAQRSKDYEIAYWKHKPDSLTRPIHMPERDYNPHYQYEGSISNRQQVRVVIIGSDTIYRKLFWRYIYTNDSLAKYKKANTDPWWYNWMAEHHVDSLPQIDFTKNELLLYAACAQCLAYCEYDTDHRSCHRNACNFRESWFIRERN
jgi:hypothetical protein